MLEQCSHCGAINNYPMYEECWKCCNPIKKDPRTVDVPVSIVPMSESGTYVYSASTELPRTMVGKVYLRPDGSLVVK